MKAIIASLLLEHLWPTYVLVRDNTRLHKGHQGTTKTEDTHFSITVVTDQFESVNLPARHRKLYTILNKQLEEGVHALQINAYTSSEWARKEGVSHG
jgi:BolA-like protein 1